MPATLERIRASMKVAPTAQQKGLALTIRLVAYDNGLVQLDGIPLNDQTNYDAVTGWLGANEVITATISEFYRRVKKRQSEMPAAKPVVGEHIR